MINSMSLQCYISRDTRTDKKGNREENIIIPFCVNEFIFTEHNFSTNPHLVERVCVISKAESRMLILFRFFYPVFNKVISLEN